jgi:hypothetical protein
MIISNGSNSTLIYVEYLRSNPQPGVEGFVYE